MADQLTVSCVAAGFYLLAAAAAVNESFKQKQKKSASGLNRGSCFGMLVELITVCSTIYTPPTKRLSETS
jgi:hypothetical protein